MHPKERRKAAALCCGLLLIGSQALAHGDSHQPKEQAPLIREQKAWGIAADPAPGIRTIRVVMNDQMRFVPNTLSIKEGDSVRIVVQNAGKLMHELVIGTREELDAHAELMRRFPNMQHDEPYMAHVEPDKAGEIVWTFNRPGTFYFACLIAGHYEAGMIGTIEVNGRAAALRNQ